MKSRTAEARRPEPDSKVATNGAAPQQGRNDELSPGGPSIGDLGFWDQLQSLTDSQWQYHVVYLYRTEPAIRNGNDKNFIAKLTRPFDEADVLSTHGSGKYLAILNNSRERRTIGKISFSCYHPDAPPKVRLAQLAPNADESWRTWLEDVESKRMQTAPAATGSRPESQRVETDPATSEAIRQMGELSKQILARQARADDGGKEVGGAPALDPTLATLLTQMASGRDQLAEKLADRSHGSGQADPISLLEKAASVILKLQPTAPQPLPALDPLEQVRRTVEVVGLLRDNFGNSTVESNGALETVMTNLPGVLQASSNLIGTVINGIAIARAGGNIRTGNGVTQMQQTPTTGPTTVSAPPPALATGGQADPTPTAPARGEMKQSDTQQLPTDLSALVQSAIDALHRGIDGGSFADGVFLTRGALYLRTIQSIGVDGIMAAVVGLPQVQSILPQIQQWVVDFCSYDPDRPEGEDEVEEGDAVAKKPPKKREAAKASAAAAPS